MNSNFKITEKLDQLENYKKEINQKIKQTIIDITKEYKYCPMCKEYYKEKAWENEFRTETRTLCTYTDCGYGDNDIYESVKCNVQYGICPIGHYIEEKVL